MDIPPWLLLEYFQVTQGSASISTGTGPVIASDPSRIYLAFFVPGGLNARFSPDGFPSPANGYQVHTTTNFIDFTFKDHPAMINMGWNCNISAPATIYWISIGYKPEV